jgi:TDG/mug DNA glycosylase family protein
MFTARGAPVNRLDVDNQLYTRPEMAKASSIDRKIDDTDPGERTRLEVGLISYDSDILVTGLDVIFCGLNPASSAAIEGHNFSNRNNRFWRVLHLAGITDVRLQPQDERRLLEYGCGITAVVRRPTKRAAEVSPEEFRQARFGFEAKVRRYAPRSIAFLGKRALSIMIGQPVLDWGRQPLAFAGTMAWILPNPSGLNRSFTLDALVTAYSELRIALALPGALHPVTKVTTSC